MGFSPGIRFTGCDARLYVVNATGRFVETTAAGGRIPSDLSWIGGGAQLIGENLWKTTKYRLTSADPTDGSAELSSTLTLCYEFPSECELTSRGIAKERVPYMNVLIVQTNPALAEMWQRHLQRHGHTADITLDQDSAVDRLADRYYPIIILDVVLDGGSAIAVADYASYRHPNAQVIFVTNTSFFSDGSIFQLCSNACAFVPSATLPEDLAAMVEHYAKPN